MDIKYFLEKDIEDIDPETNEPSGIPYDRHILQVEINGQIFKQAFLMTDGLKAHNWREEAKMFGRALIIMGKDIMVQAERGVELLKDQTFRSI